MNKEEKKGVYKFLHWCCFVLGCFFIFGAYMINAYENSTTGYTSFLTTYAHVSALAIFIFLNFIGWCINNYLVGENKIYPFKAKDWSFHGYVIVYTFTILLVILFD